MSEGAIVSIVAMVGWLVLMLSGYRSFKVDGRKTIMMAGVWLGVFLFVFIAFSLGMGE